MGGATNRFLTYILKIPISDNHSLALNNSTILFKEDLDLNKYILEVRSILVKTMNKEKLEVIK